MDLLRRTYRSEMRLFRDDLTVKVKGQWYECPDGAVFYPKQHVFGSSTYLDRGTEAFDPQLGEVIAEKTGVPRRRKQRLTGKGWCGSAEAWSDGDPIDKRGSLVVDIDGIPLCCPVDRPAPPAGEADDGEALVIPDYDQVAAEADDGAASVREVLIYWGSGGDADDGQAVAYLPTEYVGSGGDADDGQAVAYLPTEYVGSGGDADDGEAATTGPSSLTFTGCTLSGPNFSANFLGPPPLGPINMLITWNGSQFAGTYSLGGGNTFHAILYDVSGVPTAQVWVNSLTAATAASSSHGCTPAFHSSGHNFPPFMTHAGLQVGYSGSYVQA